MESYIQDDQETSHICERWFKMPSKVWATEAASDPYLCQLLMWLAYKARFTETTVSMEIGKSHRTFRLMPGELIVGRNASSSELKWNPSTFRNRLHKLQEMGLITIRTCKAYSIVSLVFLVQQSKKTSKKDNPKNKGLPTNPKGNKAGEDSKRTTEGQLRKSDIANKLPSDSASKIEPTSEKRTTEGQLKDNWRTTEGQLEDTYTDGTDESDGKNESDERESPPPEFILAIFKDYPSLPESDHRRLTAEILGAIEQGDVARSGAEYKLRQWIGATIARNAKAPKTFDIVQSSDPSETDPSDSTTSTLTPSPSASAAVPTFDEPSEWTVQRFFETEIYPSQHRFHYESHTAFRRMWHCQGWKRDGEYIDWEKEALRPKRVASSSTSSASTASTSTASTSTASASTASASTTSTSITRAIPTDTSIAKSQIVAAILKAGEE